MEHKYADLVKIMDIHTLTSLLDKYVTKHKRKAPINKLSIVNIPEKTCDFC